MLKVLKAGFFSSIQDVGRFGYRHIGVPVSGAMDAYAAGIANHLLENEGTDAVMELTMTGPVLEFEVPTYIAITGAGLSPKLNDRPLENNRVHRVKKDEVLSFGKLEEGFRSYLAVHGGFRTERKLGSRSMYKPITPVNRIGEHMEIPITACKKFDPKISNISPESFHKEIRLTVFRGPEYEILNDRQLESLFSGEFTVAKENNRMGYQLNESIEHHSLQMLTSATIPGTVQLTPDGKLIILMRDGQTTGGYPRVLQLAVKSISVLSQKKSGDRISFKLH